MTYLTALENVQIALYLAGVAENEQKARAEELLARVGLADRMDHKPTELSVGQQQRVALARMLANDPAVILADEPTGNLDPQTSEQIIQFFKEFNEEGRTIVMVTHDPKAAEKLNVLWATPLLTERSLMRSCVLLRIRLHENRNQQFAG